MNSKFLYAATVAISLASSFALADEAPVSRAQVNTELKQAIASGSLQRTEYAPGADRTEPLAASTKTRGDVALELAQERAARKVLLGSNANRNYNPLGTQIFATSTLTRTEVKEDVREAAANGTLQRTDFDYDAAAVARRANAHAASAGFAQRLKARFSRTHG